MAARTTKKTTNTQWARTARRTLCMVAIIAGAAAIAVMEAGCQRVLFPENAPRTQFETHDRLRHRTAPLHEYDEFGREQPALRSRLSPART